MLLTLIGGFAANIIGRMLVGLGDRIIRHMPIVGSVYSALKQIFQSAVREDGQGFSKVALIEYPRKRLFAVAFVTNAADTRINETTGEEMTAVFADHAQSDIRIFIVCADAGNQDFEYEC